MKLRAATSGLVITALTLAAAGLGLAPHIAFPWGITVIAALIVGGLLTARAPANPVGWAMLACGVATALGLTGIWIAELAGSDGAAGWFDAAGNAAATAGVLAIPWALLRFPDGRLASSRWRVVESVVVGAAALGFLAALLNGGWGGDAEQAGAPSPLRAATSPAGDVLSAIFFPALMAAMIGSAVSLIVRYRRSKGEERLQIKWLAYAGAFLIVAFLTVTAGTGFARTTELWQQLMMSLAFAGVPAAIAVAVLRYRLYDIDLVINRTVVLAVVAGFITGVYAVIVVGIGTLVGGGSPGLGLPIAATAVVAVAFEPVRNRAQRWANRLVYGQRATPYEVLAGLTERLAVAEEEEGILERMAGLVREGTGAQRASVWLGSEDALRPGASSPSGPPGQSEVSARDLTGDVFTVHHDGETVGVIELVKPRGTQLTPTERNLVADLAGSAGLVLGHRRLLESLKLRARELDESRRRLLNAQDTERRRLERSLRDGAQRTIDGVRTELRQGARLAEQHGAGDLTTLLEGLADEASAALEDVHALARGIYPPLLEGQGLAAAVAGLAGSMPVAVSVDGDGIGRCPPEIEAAIYFHVSEAITNAVKHGAPPIQVTLSRDAGILRFAVTDAGPGFDPDTVDGGSGMRNMADRLEAVGGRCAVHSAPGRPTVVSGNVPLTDRRPHERAPAQHG